MTAAALRAEAWSGESFLHPGEEAAEVLAEGRARRRALDAALAEIDAGRRSPSPAWKVEYALMLGLERVLTDKPSRLASGTELRRHQIDALAGMLAELIARHEQEAENGNGHENGASSSRTGSRRTKRSSRRTEPEGEEGDEGEELGAQDDPGAVRRYRFRHPTASGKTIAAGGLRRGREDDGRPDPHAPAPARRPVHARPDHRGLRRPAARRRARRARSRCATTRSRSRPTPGSPATSTRVSRTAYQLVICDEAHTALGEKTSAAIRRFTEPIYIGMTATEQLIAKQVSDVFPASVDDLPLGDAARRGLIAPLRSLRVRPAAAISSVPIVGGDYDQEILAKVLDQDIFNQAAASLYRDRFDATPGIVYAAGVDHAYNLAREFRAAGLKAEAVSGRTPPVRLAETLAAYERGDINVLINAQLLAEGWNSPRATVCMHLAPTASRRVYQQRIGRIMRLAPRKEAGIVIDFVDDAATHNDRTITIHSLLDSDFYRPGARVTPAPRRRIQRRAKRKLSPAPWLVPVTPDPRRRVTVITREWERVDPGRLAEDEQLLWARIAGRQVRFEERQAFAEKLARASRECREAFLTELRCREPEPPAPPLGPRRPRRGLRRPRRLRRPRHHGHLRADLGEGPGPGRPHPPARDRRREGGGAPRHRRPLDLAPRPRDAQDPGPPRERRPARGEAASRRAHELARTPPRGERGQPRQRRPRAADPRRGGAARLRRGVHADRAAPDRRRPRADRQRPGGGERARRQPARAEAALEQVAPPAAQEEAQGRTTHAGPGRQDRQNGKPDDRQPPSARGPLRRAAEAAEKSA